MDITATLTAVMAICSFGFIAAVILKPFRVSMFAGSRAGNAPALPQAAASALSFGS